MYMSTYCWSTCTHCIVTSCFLHCINLAVKADFNNLTVVNADDKELNGCDLELDEHFEDLTLDAGYQWELKQDIIAKVRKLVAACCASGLVRKD